MGAFKDMENSSDSVHDDRLKVMSKMVIHDIKNNLSMALGYMGLIKEGNASEGNSLLDKAYEAVGKAIDLSRKMTQIETLAANGITPQRMNIEHVIGESSKNLDIDIETRGNCDVEADFALYSVFENLFNNAIIHGGASKVVVETAVEGDRCVITVSDNGKGFSQDIIDVLFDEGMSHGANRGTGLGLYLVKYTVERYGGKVSAGNSMNGGAVFRMILPLWKDR